MRTLKKMLFVLLMVLLLSSKMDTNAAVKPYIGKKNIVLEINEVFKIKVHDTKKKVKWEVDKKFFDFNTKGNTIKVRALTVGKTEIKAKVGKQILKCKVRVMKTPFSKRKPSDMTYDPRGVLSWKKVSGADGYKIYEKKEGSSQWKMIKTIKGENNCGYSSYKKLMMSKSQFKMRAYRKVNGRITYSKFTTQVMYLDIAVEKVE